MLEFTMSFIKMLKNKGPKIDPWGIPVLISKRSSMLVYHLDFNQQNLLYL